MTRPTQMPNGEAITTAVLAYRIYCAGNDCGWDMTLADLAEALDEPVARVRRIAQMRRWLGRFRSGTLDHAGVPEGHDDLTDWVAA